MQRSPILWKRECKCTRKPIAKDSGEYDRPTAHFRTRELEYYYIFTYWRAERKLLNHVTELKLFSYILCINVIGQKSDQTSCQLVPKRRKRMEKETVRQQQSLPRTDEWSTLLLMGTLHHIYKRYENCLRLTG